MAAADTIYAARFSGPEMIEAGRSNALTCPLYRDGAVVAPASGTFTLTRSDGSVVVSGAASIVSSVATYTVTSGDTSAETRGDTYQVEWTLVVSGTTYRFRRRCVIGRSRLHPVVTDADLTEGRHSDLARVLPAARTTFQLWLDESWKELLHQLELKGSLPNLIMEPEKLRYLHMFMALEALFNDASMTPNSDRWAAQRDRYAAKVTAAWRDLVVRFDADDDGVPDQVLRPLAPVTFLCGGD